MFCTVIGKRRSFRFIISPFTAESPPERTEYFGIVSRPPTRECGSKGQVSSPKRNHAARKLRVIFGLMPALFFICFAKIESRLKCKTEKSCAWSNGFYIRARFALCYINAKRHLSAKSLVGDFLSPPFCPLRGHFPRRGNHPQSLEYFGNIRCGVCSEANTVLIMLHKSN